MVKSKQFTPNSQQGLNANQPGFFGNWEGVPIKDQPPQVPFNDMVSTFHRIGGIDGIMTNLARIQKMYGLFQQMRPMLEMMGLVRPTVNTKNNPSSKMNRKY